MWRRLLASFRVRDRKYLSIGFIFRISETLMIFRGFLKPTPRFSSSKYSNPGWIFRKDWRWISCPRRPKMTLMSRIECSYKFCKFYDFSLNSTRYTKIRGLNDFSVRCAKIYDFMLIDQQAPACGFYKIYKIYDFSLPSQFFNKLLWNLRFFALLCYANSTY